MRLTARKAASGVVARSLGEYRLPEKEDTEKLPKTDKFSKRDGRHAAILSGRSLAIADMHRCARLDSGGRAAPLQVRRHGSRSDLEKVAASAIKRSTSDLDQRIG